MRETKKELNFSGGLNLVAPATEIADNELTVCDNFLIRRDGNLVKRPGMSYTSSPGEGASIRFLALDHRFDNILISDLASSGTRAWKTTPSGFSSPLSGLAGGEVVNWGMFINNIFYIGTSVGVKALTTSTVVGGAAASSPVNTLTAAWHKQRLFAAVGLRVFVSKSTDPTIWASPDGGSFDVGVEDGEPISCIISMGDLLLVFKPHSTHAVYVQGDAPSQWVIRKLSDSVGCFPQRGAIPALFSEGSVYFAGPNGIYQTNGNSFQPLGDKIWLDTDNVYTKYTLFPSSWRVTRWHDWLIVNWFRNNLVDVGACFILNLRGGGWTKWTFLGKPCFSDIFAIPDYTGYSFAGMVASLGLSQYVMNEDYIFDKWNSTSAYNAYKDNQTFQTGDPTLGQAFTASFQTKAFTTNLDEYLRLKWLGLEYKGWASPEFKIIGDDVNGEVVSPGFNSSLVKSYRMPGAGRRRKFAIRCDHTIASPFEFYRANVHVSSHAPLAATGTP